MFIALASGYEMNSKNLTSLAFAQLAAVTQLTANVPSVFPFFEVFPCCFCCGLVFSLASLQPLLLVFAYNRKLEVIRKRFKLQLQLESFGR